MTTKRKITVNTAAQLAGKAATTLTTLLATVIITRRFGPEGYGDFTVMLAFPALFYIVSDFGFNAIAARDIAGDETKTGKYLANLLGVRAVLSAALFLLGAVLLSFFPYSSAVKIGVLLGLLTIVTQALVLSANVVFQVKLRYDFSAIAAVSGGALILVLVAFFSAAGFGLPLIVLSYVLGGALTAAVSFAFVRKIVGGINLGTDGRLWRYFFLSALPLGITTIFAVFLQKADSLLLSVLTDNSRVGFYGAAYKVFEVALVLPTFFVNAAYPVMIRHFRESRERFLRTVKFSALALLYVAVLGSLLGITAAPWVIQVVAGSGFSPSIGALRLLFVGLPIFYLSALCLWVLITLGGEKKLPFIYGTGAIFNVAANIIFIPRYSFYASAVITWISELIILILLAVTVFRSLKQKRFELPNKATIV